MAMEQNEQKLNITLDVDEDGIWLITEDEIGFTIKQLGHISWATVHHYLKQYEANNAS